MWHTLTFNPEGERTFPAEYFSFLLRLLNEPPLQAIVRFYKIHDLALPTSLGELDI